MSSYHCYAGFFPFPAVMLEHIYTHAADDPNQFYKRMSENLVDFVEPSYRLRATRDGLFHIRLKDKDPPVGVVDDSASVAESRRTYLGYLNAFYLLLDSTLLTTEKASLLFLEEISVRDLLIVTYDDDDNFQAIADLGLGYASYLENARMLPKVSSGGHPMTDERLSGRVVVAPTIVRDANFLLSKVASSTSAFYTISQLAKCLSEFNKGNFESAFTMAWFAIERSVFEWAHRVDGGSVRSETDSQGIAKTITVLRKAGLVAGSLLDQIDQLRLLRNVVVHQFESARCSSSDCENAFRVLTSYLAAEHGVGIALNTQRRLRIVG